MPRARENWHSTGISLLVKRSPFGGLSIFHIGKCSQYLSQHSDMLAGAELNDKGIKDLKTESETVESLWVSNDAKSFERAVREPFKDQNFRSRYLLQVHFSENLGRFSVK